MNSINYSEVESRRFNKEIFRVSLEKLDLPIIKRFYEENDPDILILRVPVAEQHKMFGLNVLDKDVIYADILVEYQVDLRNTVYHEGRNNNLLYVAGDNSHEKIFESLIHKIFTGYENHYYSNPVLERNKITEGYIEWVINTISVPDNMHLLVYISDIPVGFITCKYNNHTGEIILNGVLPEYQKRGIYTDMVRYMKKYFNNLNVTTMRVSTQIQNFNVQKVWNREDLVLDKAYITVHLNKKGIHEPI